MSEQTGEFPIRPEEVASVLGSSLRAMRVITSPCLIQTRSLL